MKYYLYRHIRLDKNEVFYIGIGTITDNDIKYRKFGRAISTYGRNGYWTNIINKTEYVVQIIYQSDNKEQIIKKEIEFIKLYGRKDLGLGTLVNMTDGGDGFGRKNEHNFKKILIFNKDLKLLYKAKNSKDASFYIFNTENKHKQIITNCKFGFLTDKKYYVCLEKNYIKNKTNFRLIRKKVKPPRNNCKSFYYNSKFYETKELLKKELNVSRRKFNKIFQELLNKMEIKWK